MLGVVAQQRFGLAADRAPARPPTRWPSVCCMKRSSFKTDVPMARAVDSRGPQPGHSTPPSSAENWLRSGSMVARQRHALAQLGAVAERFEQPQVKHDQHQPGVGGHRARSRRPSTSDVEDGAVFHAVFGQQIDHLGQVVGVGGQDEVFADGPEGFEGVGLRDDVELAADGEHHVAQGEGLEVAGRAAGRAAHAFGDRANLADVARIERDDAVGFAQVHALEDDRRGAVQALARHAGCA